MAVHREQHVFDLQVRPPRMGSAWIGELTEIDFQIAYLIRTNKVVPDNPKLGCGRDEAREQIPCQDQAKLSDQRVLHAVVIC